MNDEQVARLIDGVCRAVVQTLRELDGPAAGPPPGPGMVDEVDPVDGVDELPEFKENDEPAAAIEIEPPPADDTADDDDDEIGGMRFEIDMARLKAEGDGDAKRAAMLARLAKGLAGGQSPATIRRVGRTLGLFDDSLGFPVPPVDVEEEDEETILRRAKQEAFIRRKQARDIRVAKGQAKPEGPEAAVSWGPIQRRTG